LARGGEVGRVALGQEQSHGLRFRRQGVFSQWSESVAFARALQPSLNGEKITAHRRAGIARFGANGLA